VTGCGGSLRGDIYTSEDIKTDGTVNASFRFKEYDLSVNVNEAGEASGFPAKVQHGQPAELELIAEEGGAVLCSAKQLGNYALIGVWGKS
jgi:hypothetical protein